MVNKLHDINLLKGKEKSFWDKFIGWALTVGRFLVIVTETVALAAFLYRFSLDRKLVDLHDEIKHKQIIVEAASANEKIYRNLQNRITLSTALVSSEDRIISLLSELISKNSSDLTLTSTAITPETLKIETSVRSIPQLSSFIKTLKSYPLIESVSIDKIENRTSNAAIFVAISAKLKKT